jgi:septal ring factor EnvC (AmiA/AmiB activator)
MADEPVVIPRLADVLGASIREELREAQRRQWRSEAKFRSTLDQLGYLERVLKARDSEVFELHRLVDELNRELERLADHLNGVTGSRAWQLVLRVRRLKGIVSRSSPG